MKRLCVALFLVLCVAPLAARADFIPLPVKWSQLPVAVDDGTGLKHFVGVDYLSNHQMGVVVADDFICDNPLPIVAVRWWGSYLQDAPGMVRDVQPGFATPFDISFHVSLMPGGSIQPHPFSRPGTLVYLNPVKAQEQWTGLFDDSGRAVYMYNAHIPPFDQWFYAHMQVEPGQIPGELFLDICRPGEEIWGWHETRPNPINDYAWELFGDHVTLRSQTETDMAFELMVPEPMTMGLLGAGLVGMFCRRKRH
jgi:hypothetical protein